ncbi:MAG TPA: hypothetical protein VLF39_03500 [Candidatus Saccharimonadales bacterium]|nr:hypothetical protein [Candidatus Saccharimonadales bacterium]
MEYDSLFEEPSKHPEIDDSLEAMQPVTEATKTALVELVSNKVGELLPKTIWKSRKLQRPNHYAEIINVMRYGPTASRNPAGKVIEVSVYHDSSDQPEFLKTTFTVSESPDGLQMSRQTKLHKPIMSLGQWAQAKSIASVLGTNESQKLQAEREDQSLENELGLSFVSEADAQEVMTIVSEAHPIIIM